MKNPTSRQTNTAQAHNTVSLYSKVGSKRLSYQWQGSAIREEATLHQVSPYIGKMKSSMASALISTFTRAGNSIYDPFCGSGTIALEAWSMGRHIIANDLSPYAVTLTRAKLFPPNSVEDALNEIKAASKQVDKIIQQVDLRTIPLWVRNFFHPETLREASAWSRVLQKRKSHFLLSCLLGILHHQRPGFLSYPSSHTVPYLRERIFPQQLYPHLYEYRPVQDRLEKKVNRAFKRLPQLDPKINRICYMRNAAKFVTDVKVEAIITSPPYMRQLDYARDNRLRLWFLGKADWKSLDDSISPSETQFLSLIKRCLKLWLNILTPSGICVLVLGDNHSRLYDMPLPNAVAKIAIEDVGGYSMVWKYTEQIPSIRRVRRNCSGNQSETFLVLRRK
jgi:hypothetical protein